MQVQPITSVIDKTEFNENEVILNSIVLGSLNVLAGLGSGIGFSARIPGTTFSYKFISTLISMGTEAFYDISSYIYGDFTKRGILK